MSIGPRLDLRQSQSLVMTPQLQQAIKMLQMSNLELTAFVEGELQRNPLLERAEDRGPGEPAAPSAATREGADVALSRNSVERASEVFDTGSENLYADMSLSDRAEAASASAPLVEGAGGVVEGAGGFDGEAGAWAENSAWGQVGRGGSSKFEDADHSLEGRAVAEISLREHLLAQLGQAAASPSTRLVAADLIEALDDAGYLLADLNEVAARLGAAMDEIDAAVGLLQSFDPTGVGARGLKECLALQLKERDRFDPAMAAMIDNLELLAAAKLPKLKSVCRVDDEDLGDMIREIRSLDPKPGLAFAADLVQTVSPDVFVTENRFGGFQVELNMETLPRVLVNKTYAAEVLRSAAGAKRDQAVKEYLSECQQSASWLVKSIDQRAKTILRVASEIVRQQDGFFAYGVGGLRPLNLKQVADAIEMHESTVSRVTSNKYIGTPRGLFEMKYFFTPAIAATDGGESYSAETIRHRIRSLIDAETADGVLSDDRIVTLLRESGVDIARRTVTKYREAMGIASSIKRRRVKASIMAH